MKELRFNYPEIPESVNKLYFVRGGRKVLSTTGRKFKNQFILSRGGLPVEDLMAFEPQKLAKYELELWFFLRPDRLTNFTFGIDRRVKSPYANIDTSNLFKLFEDCISELTGIGDRNNFSIHAHKRSAGSRPEKVKATLRPLTETEDEYDR